MEIGRDTSEDDAAPKRRREDRRDDISDQQLSCCSSAIDAESAVKFVNAGALEQEATAAMEERMRRSHRPRRVRMGMGTAAMTGG